MNFSSIWPLSECVRVRNNGLVPLRINFAAPAHILKVTNRGTVDEMDTAKAHNQ